MLKRVILILVVICCTTLSACAMSGAISHHQIKRNKQQTKLEDEPRASITLKCMDKTYVYNDDIIAPTDHLVAETLHARSINARLSVKLNVVERSLNAGGEMRDAFSYCFPKITAFVDKMVKENVKPAEDSKITFCPDETPMFKITREQKGYCLSENRIYQEIYMGLQRGANIKSTIIPSPILPTITVEDNIKLTNLRSKFTTHFSGSPDNRKSNISLSLKKINGCVLQPNQQFSFNKTVGRRSAANGFLPAKIIKDGSYIMGYGGGVCQSSTTLYNAAIRADMQIDMANNHSLAPSYVPPSFDAMVNSSSSDLKFTNKGDKPVFIRCVTNSDTATVEIYGTPLPYTIETKSVEISRGEVPEDAILVDIDRKHVPTDACPGQRFRVSYGHAPLSSEGYLVYYDLNHNEISRKLIRRDTYGKTQGIIAIAP